MLLLIPALILFRLYAGLFYHWYRKFKNAVPFNNASNIGGPSVSIIIPARNEEQYIGRLLRAIKAQDYDTQKTEIIVVDDHSHDNTAAIVNGFEGVKLISLTADDINSYKKKAVETGINNATGELILVTDADCIPPKSWVSEMVNCYLEKNSVFIAGPVRMRSEKSLVSYFQSVDFSMMQGITIASVTSGSLSMCNGANIAYTKKAFESVNGFAGIDHIASGDDMMLMQKMKQEFPGRLSYLYSKNVIVETEAAKSWAAFLRQRIRWASKARKYEDKRMFAVLLIVYLFNLVFPVLVIAGILQPVCLWAAGALWILKTLTELPLLWHVNRFFSQATNPFFFFLLQPLHILYVLLSGLLGQITRYEWKGRRVK